MWTAFATTAALGAVLALLDAGLRTEAAPLGIVSFELARTADQASAIVASWDPEALVDAALLQGLDYLFLIAYSALIAMWCLRAAGRVCLRAPRLAASGSLLALAQPLAGALDAVENFALIQLLRGSSAAVYPAIAFACAVPKFIIVFAGLAYAGVAPLLAGSRSRR